MAAFKSEFLVKRRQWRSIYVVFDEEERKEILRDTEKEGEERKENSLKLNCILLMKKRIEQEIKDLCKEAYVEIRYFLRAAVSNEARVFYLKMLGDTFRYLSQVTTGSSLIKIMKETDERYLKAMAEAEALEHTNPLKLILCLNYSCFKYEIEQNFD